MKTFWTWNWKNGGHCSCTIAEAPTLAAAKRRAKELALGEIDRLVADPKSFRQVTTAEMSIINFLA